MPDKSKKAKILRDKLIKIKLGDTIAKPTYVWSADGKGPRRRIKHTEK